MISRYLLPTLLLCLASACAAVAQSSAASTGKVWAPGVEAQIYPAGAVAAVYAERRLSEQDSLMIRGGYNFTERGDFGEHDEESGGGPGIGLTYRHGFVAGREDGWFAGARVDLWLLDVDWEDDPSVAARSGRSGSTDIVVLQPAAELGYGWWQGMRRLDLTLTLGAEINVDTDGEDVGEGAIVLIGVRYSL